MRAFIVCVAFATLMLPSRADAQSPPLAESEALAQLSPDSPRVRAIRAAIDIARADVSAAARWPNPRLIFDRESVAGVSENMTMVAQPLPITGRRGLEVDAANLLVDATSHRADDTMRRARADLRLVFAQLVAAQIREREFTAARDRLNSLAGLLAKREMAGDAAGFDRLRADREVVEIDADRASAATERARAQAAIASFFAEQTDPSQVVAAARAPASSSPLPPLAALLEQAESIRGDLLALAKDLESARVSARAADRRKIPEPEIVAGTKSSSLGGGLGSVITIQASVPLFDRGQPERALALARANQAQTRVEQFRLALRADVSALRAAVIERRETADRYRAASVKGADEIERIAQVSYDAGERGILELLDAYRTGAAARIRQALLDLSVRQSEIELEFVSGWETP
jgi:cobalt-zinc-cadmium efflux system outer membrane protein